MNYWPWWLGALALGLITVGYPLWTGRTFGMSGSINRVLSWRDSREVDALDARADSVDLRAALAAATAEQFGSESTTDTMTVPPRTDGGTGRAAAPPSPPQRPLPVVFAAVMLVSVFVGGLIASVTSGRFALHTDLGPVYDQVVTGNPWLMTLILFVGGVMVGVGVRMAGGCTSGHGLTGCSRLHPVSLVATATFFGTAVAVSMLLWKVI